MSVSDTTFFERGDAIMFGHDEPSTRHDLLPADTYRLAASMETGFYLERSRDFPIPSKIYGDLSKTAHKILNTFNDRPSTTGVLLSGEKGSGKTLLTKLISSYARDKGIPTILVNMPAAGDAFSSFLQKITQPVILLFDEFEKVYDKEAQQALLTLLDGVYAGKKLFLFTSNSYTSIDDNMKNRPGRIYYSMDFNGLDPSFVAEYAEDKLKNKNHVKILANMVGLIKPMNFDMLQAIVEESNRYDESPMETLKMINVKATGWNETFLYTLTVPKNVKILQDNTRGELRANPLGSVGIEYHTTKTVKGKIVPSEYKEIYFTGSDLVAMDGTEGKYEYRNGDGFTLKLIRKPYEKVGTEKYADIMNGLL
jgi:ATPase family associated with various cellular activities (AAA)